MSPPRKPAWQVELLLGLGVADAEVDGCPLPPLPGVLAEADGEALAAGLFEIVMFAVFGIGNAGSPTNFECVPCISFMNSAQIGIETEAPKENPLPLMLSTGACTWTLLPVFGSFSVTHRDTATAVSSFEVYPLNHTAAVL